ARIIAVNDRRPIVGVTEVVGIAVKAVEGWRGRCLRHRLGRRGLGLRRYQGRPGQAGPQGHTGRVLAAHRCLPFRPAISPSPVSPPPPAPQPRPSSLSFPCLPTAPVSADCTNRAAGGGRPTK